MSRSRWRVEGQAAVPLLAGYPPSELDHVILEGLTIRLYLLSHEDGTLGVEIDDVHGSEHLDQMSAIAEKLAFAPSK